MDEKTLLEAVGQMMDEKLARQKAEIVDEVTQSLKTLLDAEVLTKLNLLVEGQEELLRRMPGEEEMNLIDAASIFWK